MKTVRLTGTEPLTLTGDHTVADFWSWAYSDILSNRNRAIFAEFIVATALGCTDQPRKEWDEVDVCYRGKKIEVKASAYLQSWPQDRPSRVVFDISPKKGWQAETNTSAPEPTRSADCFVFCLFTATDKAKGDILDLHCWEFYTLGTNELNERYPSLKSLSLKRLQTLCSPVAYSSLKETIDRLLFN